MFICQSDNVIIIVFSILYATFLTLYSGFKIPKILEISEQKTELKKIMVRRLIGILVFAGIIAFCLYCIIILIICRPSKTNDIDIPNDSDGAKITSSLYQEATNTPTKVEIVASQTTPTKTEIPTAANPYPLPVQIYNPKTNCSGREYLWDSSKAHFAPGVINHCQWVFVDAVSDNCKMVRLFPGQVETANKKFSQPMWVYSNPDQELWIFSDVLSDNKDFLYTLPVAIDDQEVPLSSKPNICKLPIPTSTPTPSSNNSTNENSTSANTQLQRFEYCVNDKAVKNIYIRREPISKVNNAIGEIEKNACLYFYLSDEYDNWLLIAPNQKETKGIIWFYQEYSGWVSAEFLSPNGNYSFDDLPKITPTPQG